MRESASWYLPSSCCKFQNILDVWNAPPEEVSATVQSLGSLQEQLEYVNSLPLNGQGWCETHARYCAYAQSDLRVQGPPCPDWSRAGLRLGVKGPNFPPLLAAGAKTKVTAPRCVIVENVPGFPKDLAQACYGSNYVWRQTFKKPEEVGFEFVARTRTQQF